jgi:two-component system, NtrC family, response regulator AtoC
MGNRHSSVLFIDEHATIEQRQLVSALPSSKTLLSSHDLENLTDTQINEFDIVIIGALECAPPLFLLLHSTISRSCVPVVLLVERPDIRRTIDAIREGAADVVFPPYDLHQIQCHQSRSSVRPRSLTRLHSNINKKGSPSLLGESPSFQEVISAATKVAPWESSILILGESGTGKEVVAKFIHTKSHRAHGPFVAVNCAAIPESLVESELFGHEKGAFTHALERRVGLIESAQEGTLFLDEIGELSLKVQAKLLRFLQDKEYFRVGNPKPLVADVRILSATNQNLDDLVKRGTFRLDLLYRINVAEILLPPLRERKEDIPLLLEHFALLLAERYEGRALHFTNSAINVLCNYFWPGNIRELEHFIERLLILSDETSIVDAPIVRDLLKLTGRSLEMDDVPRRKSMREPVFSPQDITKESFEAWIYATALAVSQHNISQAASLLSLSPRAFALKLREKGIALVKDGNDK